MCCAAVLPGFARSPRAERLWAGSLLVPATQHGAGCGVQFVEESGAGGRWSRVRWSRERCGCRPRSSVGNVRGGGAWPWAAHPREAMEGCAFLRGD